MIYRPSQPHELLETLWFELQQSLPGEIAPVSLQVCGWNFEQQPQQTSSRGRFLSQDTETGASEAFMTWCVIGFCPDPAVVVVQLAPTDTHGSPAHWPCPSPTVSPTAGPEPQLLPEFP